MGAENSSMANATCNSNSSCKNPFGAKETDTVKIDMAKLVGGGDKENQNPQPSQMKETAAQKMQRLEKENEQQQWEMEQQRLQEEQEQRQMERRRLEAEKAAQRAAEEEKRRREQEAEEQRRRQAELAEQERQRKLAAAQALQRKKEEEEKRRRYEEEQRRLALEEMERQKKLQEEEEARIREEERKAEEALKMDLLREWLRTNDFPGPNDKKVKKSMLSSSFQYPLHAAVELNDTQAVCLLLWAGADRTLKNSKKQTPFDLATAKNSKNGSHKAVITALSKA